jgi:hypothetical protein
MSDVNIQTMRRQSWKCSCLLSRPFGWPTAVSCALSRIAASAPTSVAQPSSPPGGVTYYRDFTTAPTDGRKAVQIQCASRPSAGGRRREVAGHQTVPPQGERGQVLVVQAQEGNVCSSCSSRKCWRALFVSLHRGPGEAHMACSESQTIKEPFAAVRSNVEFRVSCGAN